MMSRPIRTTRRKTKGVALIVVLSLIMAITVLSLGMLTRSQTEMACGENMALRMQMDQLAASGLEHARGLILNPQEIGSLDNWTADAQQLDTTGNDFYDVNIVADATDSCNYDIFCRAYRVENAQTLGRSNLTGQLRLDPCVALWTGAGFDTRSNWTIHGDLYAAGNIGTLVTGGGDPISGDAFADAAITGITTQGQTYPSVAKAPVAWPFGANTAADVIDGYLSNCTTSSISPGVLSGNLGPSNPARIYYCNGDLTVASNVTVTGMLLVNGNLTIAGSSVTINAAQGFPAIYVTGHLAFRGASTVRVNGLAVVQGKVLVGADTTDLQIVGGLFAADEAVETATDTSGYGNDAIIRNTPTRVSGTLEFDGASDYLQTVDNTTGLQLLADYSLSLQVKANPTQQAWAGILCKTDPDGLKNDWVLQVAPDASTIVVCHDTYSGGHWETGIVVADLADGAWHQLAIVRQGTLMTSYLDGTLRSSGSLLRSPLSGEGHLNIGAERTASSSYLYRGALDDIRVYNRALDATEIITLPNDPSLIGHWTFSEGGSQLELTVSPVESAFVVWDWDSTASAWQRVHWSQAGGAFFKHVRRE